MVIGWHGGMTVLGKNGVKGYIFFGYKLFKKSYGGSSAHLPLYLHGKKFTSKGGGMIEMYNIYPISSSLIALSPMTCLET